MTMKITQKLLVNLLILVLVIGAIKLSKKENENRLAICGRYTPAKVYQGREANQSEAPWAVMILINASEAGEMKSSLCSGSVVSPRHIITASHCFGFGLDRNGTRILKNTEYNKTNCDENKNYKYDDPTALKEVSIFSFNKTNQIAGVENIEQVTLVHGCVSSKKEIHSEDFAIIHLKSDLTFLETLQPICVASSVKFNEPGMRLEFFGFGMNPLPNVKVESMTTNTEQVLRHEKIKIPSRGGRNRKHQFVARDHLGNTIACPGDSGGGSIVKTESKAFLVGVVSSSQCRNVRNRQLGIEIHSSVGYYAESICELTGICQGSKYDAWHLTTKQTETDYDDDDDDDEDDGTTYQTSRGTTETIQTVPPTEPSPPELTSIEPVTKQEYFREDEEFEPLDLDSLGSFNSFTFTIIYALFSLF